MLGRYCLIAWVTDQLYAVISIQKNKTRNGVELRPSVFGASEHLCLVLVSDPLLQHG
jgi:hypothetical protein